MWLTQVEGARQVGLTRCLTIISVTCMLYSVSWTFTSWGTRLFDGAFG